MLQLHRAGHRIHHARKFRENAVTCQFNDPSLVLSDLSIDETSSHVLECCERTGFIAAHQPAVPDDIGSKNCSETAFHFVNKQSFRATVEESRYAIFKLTRRDPSTSLGMTAFAAHHSTIVLAQVNPPPNTTINT